MLIHEIGVKLDQIIEYCDRKITIKHWKIVTVFCAIGLSLFFAFPLYGELFRGELHQPPWEALEQQIAHPFTPLDYPAYTHEAKIGFRLFIPLFAHMLGLTAFQCLIFQYCALISIFFAVMHLSYTITRDKVSSVFITVGFSFIFIGNVLVSDVLGHFDSVAYAFLLAAMCFKRNIPIFLCLLCASYTDERALVATGMVLVWFWLKAGELESFTVKTICRKESKTLLVVGVWIAYFSSRFILSHRYGLKTPLAGCLSYTAYPEIIPLAAWTAFEGFCLVIISAVFLLIVSRQKLFLWLYMISMGIIVVISAGVIDKTRSIAYCVPGVFIGLSILMRYEKINMIRKITLWALVLSFFPNYCMFTRQATHMFASLPVQVIRMLR